MLNPLLLQRIASGQERAWWAQLLRGSLRLAEYPYGWAVRYRNRQYDSGRWPAVRLSVPVISVGNLTVGGTGKSPLVAWIARWLSDRGVRVAIVSRGYGGGGGANDEAMELRRQLPDVPHVQNADRVLAARQAIERFRAELVLLDDGFQHRRLARDLDIVLLDACRPLGYDHLLPRGFLREPIESLCRAHVVGLSRADVLEPPERDRIRQRVMEHAPHAGWLELAHRPCALIDAAGQSADLALLRGRRVAAFCGIGNPPAFRRTLQACGADVVAFRALPDHCRYRAAEVQRLAQWLDRTGDAEYAVCTCKDLVKLQTQQIADRPLWALAVRVEILSGGAELEQILSGVVRRREAADVRRAG